MGSDKQWRRARGSSVSSSSGAPLQSAQERAHRSRNQCNCLFAQEFRSTTFDTTLPSLPTWSKETACGRSTHGHGARLNVNCAVSLFSARMYHVFSATMYHLFSAECTTVLQPKCHFDDGNSCLTRWASVRASHRPAAGRRDFRIRQGGSHAPTTWEPESPIRLRSLSLWLTAPPVLAEADLEPESWRRG
jgi:hypothetical protein